jgi:cyclic lactone autoinducer peptide
MTYFFEVFIRILELVAKTGVTTNSYFMWHEPNIPNQFLEKEQHNE